MAQEDFFTGVAAEADEIGMRVRKSCLEMPDPAPVAMFEHIYSQPTALLAQEREQLEAYLSSFADEEVAR